MDRGRILVVDDDEFFRVLCTDILKKGGFSVKTASGGSEALKKIEDEEFDIVITDLLMPDVDGLEVLQRVKQINTLIDVIIITGHGTLETAIEALKKGAFNYIRKPLNEEELLHTAARCMEKKKLLEENQEMRQSLRLFEVTRTISSTIELNKLYNIALDAVLQIAPADAGILFFCVEEMEKLDIKSIRHIGLSAAERIVQLLKASFEKELKNLNNITVISNSELKGQDDALAGYNSFLIAPLSGKSMPAGFIMLLGKAQKNACTMKDIKNISFMVEHESQAFENAYKYAEAKEMAYIDSLTNLYNSKYLDNVLDRELKRADRLMMPVTVLFMDLDNFKLINDRNDHLVGSKVLIEIGRTLLKCVREVDTVIRYGGDEYVIVLVDADYDVALKVAERIRSAIEDHSFLEEDMLNIKVTASIGVATYPVHTRNKKDLLKAADKAMYRAKNLTKNMVSLAPIPGQQEPPAKKLIKEDA